MTSKKLTQISRKYRLTNIRRFPDATKPGKFDVRSTLIESGIEDRLDDVPGSEIFDSVSVACKESVNARSAYASALISKSPRLPRYFRRKSDAGRGEQRRLGIVTRRLDTHVSVSTSTLSRSLPNRGSSSAGWPESTREGIHRDARS